MTTASPSPATARHLALLDELADIGLVVARRLRDLPPMRHQDTARDYDILARAVRRTVLLYHLLEQDRLPNPRPPQGTDPRTADGGDRAADCGPRAANGGPEAPDGSPDPAPEADTRDSLPEPDPQSRLDPPDHLDSLALPVEHSLAAIVTDIRAALVTAHLPTDCTPLVRQIAAQPLPTPHHTAPPAPPDPRTPERPPRHEALAADLE